MKTRDRILDTVLHLISELWPASVVVGGRALGAAYMEHGIALMMQVLEPFIVQAQP